VRAVTAQKASAKTSRPEPCWTERGLFRRSPQGIQCGRPQQSDDEPRAQATNAEDAGHLAAYFSGLKCEAAPASDTQAASAGQAVASKCTACHGTDGRASNGAWPNLAGQSKDYLVNAIKAYKGGARNNGMMAGIVKDLSDLDAETAAVGAGASRPSHADDGRLDLWLLDHLFGRR
jgi:Cytochrome c553